MVKYNSSKLVKYGKIITKADGTKIKIRLDAYSLIGKELFFSKWIEYLAPRHKAWISADKNNWSYRELHHKKKQLYDELFKLHPVTEDDLLEMKLEIWESLKPKKNETK